MTRNAALLALMLAACSGGDGADAGADAGADMRHGPPLDLCTPPEAVPVAAPVVSITLNDASGAHTGAGLVDFTGMLSSATDTSLSFATAAGSAQIQVALSPTTYDAAVTNAFAGLPTATSMNVSFAGGLVLTNAADGTLLLALLDVVATTALAGGVHFAQSDVDCITVACSAGGGVGCGTGCYQGLLRSRVMIDGAAAPIQVGRSASVGAMHATVMRSVAQAPFEEVMMELGDPTHAICGDALSPELAVLLGP